MTEQTPFIHEADYSRSNYFEFLIPDTSLKVTLHEDNNCYIENMSNGNLTVIYQPEAHYSEKGQAVRKVSDKVTLVNFERTAATVAFLISPDEVERAVDFLLVSHKKPAYYFRLYESGFMEVWEREGDLVGVVYNSWHHEREAVLDFVSYLTV